MLLYQVHILLLFAECFVLNNDRTFFCIECSLLLNIGIKTLAAQDNHSCFTFWLSWQFPLVKFLVKAFYFNREITVQSNTALTICALIFTGCGSLKPVTIVYIYEGTDNDIKTKVENLNKDKTKTTYIPFMSSTDYAKGFVSSYLKDTGLVVDTDEGKTTYKVATCLLYTSPSPRDCS